MEYQIKKMPAFIVAGYKFSVSILNREQSVQIPAIWNLLKQDGRYKRLYQAMRITQKQFYDKEGLLGVCTLARNALKEQEVMDYYVGYITNKKDTLSDMQFLEVPAATWAIFPCIGPMPEAMLTLTTNIYASWTEQTSYTYTLAPDIEFYPEGDVRSPSYAGEAWVSVK